MHQLKSCKICESKRAKALPSDKERSDEQTEKGLHAAGLLSENAGSPTTCRLFRVDVVLTNVGENCLRKPLFTVELFCQLNNPSIYCPWVWLQQVER